MDDASGDTSSHVRITTTTTATMENYSTIKNLLAQPRLVKEKRSLARIIMRIAVGMHFDRLGRLPKEHWRGKEGTIAQIRKKFDTNQCRCHGNHLYTNFEVRCAWDEIPGPRSPPVGQATIIDMGSYNEEFVARMIEKRTSDRLTWSPIYVKVDTLPMSFRRSQCHCDCSRAVLKLLREDREVESTGDRGNQYSGHCAYE